MLLSSPPVAIVGVSCGVGAGVGLDVGKRVGAGVGKGVGAGVGMHEIWPVSPLVYCPASQFAHPVLPTDPVCVSTAHGTHSMTLLLPSAV